MIEIKCNNNQTEPNILVIGVGGCGNNAINRMIETGMDNVSYLAVNTDNQALESCNAATKVLIGAKLTEGFGAGANPEVGESAAVESEDSIEEAIRGADLCIITCGMGGGTGTGATPVVAKKCKEQGILTVGVVTMPFSFENTTKAVIAQKGVERLKDEVDTLLVIPNDKLIGLSEKPLLLENAFEMADSVLKYTIQGITNIIFNKGLVNLDFNDLRTTLKNKGMGHLGIGTVSVDESIIEAVKKAVNSPLLDTSIEGAANLLINTSGKVDINALNEAVSYVRDLAGKDVNIIWGTVTATDYDEDKIVVTIIATGMAEGKREFMNAPQTPQMNKKPVVVPQEKELVIPPFLSRYVR